MLGKIISRSFSTSGRRMVDYPTHGRPTHNLPFKSDNPYKFSLIFVIYFMTGINLPFWMVKYQLTK